MKRDKKEKYLPFLIFALTILLGFTSVFLSYRAQKLKISLPEIFQQAGYPAESPGTPGGGACDLPPCGPNQYIVSGCCQKCVAGDEWCCGTGDDDDDDDTPPPSPSPSPSPPPSPSPSPTLSFSCSDLTRNPSTELQIGDTVNFTCSHQAQNVTFHHYNYRIHRPSDPSDPTNTNYWYAPTEWQNLGSSTPTYTIPENGDYIVQCQACATTGSSQCTTWGQAGGWTQ